MNIDYSKISAGFRAFSGISTKLVHVARLVKDQDYQQASYDLAWVLDQPITPTTGSKITLDPTQSFFSVDLSGKGVGVTNFAITGGSIDSLNSSAVPEPSTLIFMVLGLGLSGGVAQLSRTR